MKNRSEKIMEDLIILFFWFLLSQWIVWAVGGIIFGVDKLDSVERPKGITIILGFIVFVAGAYGYIANNVGKTSAPRYKELSESDTASDESSSKINIENSNDDSLIKFRSNLNIINFENYIFRKICEKDPNQDEFYESAKMLVVDKQIASVSLLQRTFGIEYDQAKQIINKLQADGIIGPRSFTQLHSVLVNKRDYHLSKLETDMLNTKRLLIQADIETIIKENQCDITLIDRVRQFFGDNTCSSSFTPLSEEGKYIVEKEEFKFLNDLGLVYQEEEYPFNIEIETNELKIIDDWDIDNYEKNRYIFAPSFPELDDLNDGYEFEEFMGELLLKLDYTNVEVLPASNDYGVDVLAEKNKIKFAIQCKYYSSNVGVAAVQEIMGGKEHYGTHVAIVATNSYYTKNAIAMAESNRVILWDRDYLLELIDQAYVLPLHKNKEKTN